MRGDEELGELWPGTEVHAPHEPSATAASLMDALVTYRPLPTGKPPMDCRHLPEARKETLSPEPESPPPPAASSSPCLPPTVGQRAGTGPGRPAAANAARERSRVQTLRHAFLELQKTLPSVPPDTKLSKLDVLLLATTYIAHLTRSLQDEEESSGEALGALRGDGYLHPVKVGQLTSVQIFRRNRQLQADLPC